MITALPVSDEVAEHELQVEAVESIIEMALKFRRGEITETEFLHYNYNTMLTLIKELS